MTQKDGSPEASEGPYWSEELLAVLVVGLGDETQARDTLEGIIQQALSGRALQGISQEALASYLSNLYERIAESVQDSDVARRRSLTKKVEVVTEAARKAVAAAHTELSEERAADWSGRPAFSKLGSLEYASPFRRRWDA